MKFIFTLIVSILDFVSLIQQLTALLG